MCPLKLGLYRSSYWGDAWRVLQKRNKPDKKLSLVGQAPHLIKLQRPAVCNDKVFRAAKQCNRFKGSVSNKASSFLPFPPPFIHIPWVSLLGLNGNPAVNMGRPSRVHSAGKSPAPWGVHPSVRVGHAAVWRPCIGLLHWSWGRGAFLKTLVSLRSTLHGGKTCCLTLCSVLNVSKKEISQVISCLRDNEIY